MLRIAVIGAGIVGASVAFRLARRGEARVWIVDESLPGSGTTSASFSWANANDKTPRDYFELNRAGLEEHFRLRDELGGAPWLYPGGNIEWAGNEAALEDLHRRIERLRSWDYAAEWWRASRVNEILEPQVNFPGPDTPVAFFPHETWVDAPRLAKALVELARRSDAETRFGAAVEEIKAGNNGSVEALRLQGGERLPVDAVVNAAGPGADRVAALLGRRLRLRPSKGLLVRVAVQESTIGRLLHSPRVNLRPDGPGYVLVHHDSVDRELDGDAERESLCRELLVRARRVVPALEGAKVEEARVGVRPMPEDGLPCAGAVAELPGYYEVVTHSGVTLGPLLGRLLAREILSGEVDDLISPFRPDRFACAR
jgi:glycine/D-amino acid oxidase-like deaminating enzyme